MLSERCQTKKKYNISCNFITIIFQKGQNHKDGKQINCYYKVEVEGGYLNFKSENTVLNLHCVGGYMTIYILQNSLNYTLKWSDFTICKLYHYKPYPQKRRKMNEIHLEEQLFDLCEKSCLTEQDVKDTFCRMNHYLQTQSS